MDGFSHYEACLSKAEQKALLTCVLNILATAPLYRPVMPKSGRPFSVLETNCGPLGWVSDKKGYRYQTHHPVSGQLWPALPPACLELWQRLTGLNCPPEAGLINFYDEKARMGLHQDRDETEFEAPVLSISLGASATFRIGGLKRRDKTRSITLNSGDIVCFGGPSRLCYHGIDRIIKGSSDLLAKFPAYHGGRFNITLRRVTPMKAVGP